MKTRNYFYSASRRTAVAGCTLLAASWNLAWADHHSDTPSAVPSGPATCSNITDYLDCSSEGRQQDVVFVFDTTGSMGDEIAEMQDAVIEFSDAIADGGIDYRLGLTEYKDFKPIHGDNATASCGDDDDFPHKVYTVTEGETLTPNKNDMRGWIQSLVASGGNDTPESILAALAHTVTDQTWRPGVNRMAIVITDAPAHEDGHACNQEGNTLEGPDGMISQLRREGVVTHVIGPADKNEDGSIDKKSPMYRIASETGGTFFLLCRKNDKDCEPVSLTDILGKIVELMTCTYHIRSAFGFSPKDDTLNIEIKLLGAEKKAIPHIEGQSDLTVFACGGATGVSDDCAEHDLTPETKDSGETVYTHKDDASAFSDPVKLTDFSTLVKVCDFTTTTPKAPLHIGPCVPGETPKPNMVELEVSVDGNNAKVSWATDPYARGFTLFYAPYSNPIGEVTLNNIGILPLGLQTSIGAPLPSGTHLYVAVQASNCSGDSDIDVSKLGVIEIP